MTIGQQVTIPPIPHGSVIEKIIVGKLVEGFLAAGHSLSVWDGEEMTEVEETDAETIYKALASTDEDRLYVHFDKKAASFGWVYLVWGNDHEVISDYTTHPQIEAIVKPVSDWAEEQR
jgi:hypothetical protein